jgi:hypothetical protein
VKPDDPDNRTEKRSGPSDRRRQRLTASMTVQIGKTSITIRLDQPIESIVITENDMTITLLKKD